jgi:hypothetical protein
MSFYSPRPLSTPFGFDRRPAYYVPVKKLARAIVPTALFWWCMPNATAGRKSAATIQSGGPGQTRVMLLRDLAARLEMTDRAKQTTRPEHPRVEQP